MPPLDASPWEFIVSFNMYDCVALCAAIPSLRYRLFSDDAEHEYDAGTAINTIFGQSEALSGVRRPKELRQLIHAASLAGLSSMPEPYPMLIFTGDKSTEHSRSAFCMLTTPSNLRYLFCALWNFDEPHICQTLRT